MWNSVVLVPNHCLFILILCIWMLCLCRLLALKVIPVDSFNAFIMPILRDCTKDISAVIFATPVPSCRVSCSIVSFMIIALVIYCIWELYVDLVIY